MLHRSDMVDVKALYMWVRSNQYTLLLSREVTEEVRNCSAKSGDPKYKGQFTNHAERDGRLGGRRTEFKRTVWDRRMGAHKPGC